MSQPDAAPFYDDLAPYYEGARRLLDAACGIGTQALPLAARGFEVTARDLSSGAVARLEREAAARHLAIDAGIADMRSLAASVRSPFDIVIAFDNSLPHLLTDGDILGALGVLRRGGARSTRTGKGCAATTPSGCARSGPGTIRCTIG